jgi:hypothetical protein
LLGDVDGVRSNLDALSSAAVENEVAARFCDEAAPLMETVEDTAVFEAAVEAKVERARSLRKLPLAQIEF